ncbi:hypothetical protein TKK_0015260 [Trichogramma kaykai]
MLRIIREEDEMQAFQYRDEDIDARRKALRKAVDEHARMEMEMVKDLVIVDSVLYKRSNDKLCYVVPKCMRKSLVVRFHDYSGHQGLELMSRKYYFRVYRTPQERKTGATDADHHPPGVRRRRQGAASTPTDLAIPRGPETAELLASRADALTITGAERPCLDAADNCVTYGTQRIFSTVWRLTRLDTSPPPRTPLPPALPRLGPSSLQSAITRSADITATNEIEQFSEKNEQYDPNHENRHVDTIKTILDKQQKMKARYDSNRDLKLNFAVRDLVFLKVNPLTGHWRLNKAAVQESRSIGRDGNCNRESENRVDQRFGWIQDSGGSEIRVDPRFGRVRESGGSENRAGPRFGWIRDSGGSENRVDPRFGRVQDSDGSEIRAGPRFGWIRDSGGSENRVDPRIGRVQDSGGSEIRAGPRIGWI